MADSKTLFQFYGRIQGGAVDLWSCPKLAKDKLKLMVLLFLSFIYEYSVKNAETSDNSFQGFNLKHL